MPRKSCPTGKTKFKNKCYDRKDAIRIYRELRQVEKSIDRTLDMDFQGIKIYATEKERIDAEKRFKKYRDDADTLQKQLW